MQEIIRYAEAQGHGIALKLLYLTGCRVSELCRLEWKDLKQYQTWGQATFLKTKNGKARTVNIPPKLWAELEEIRSEGRVIHGEESCVWRWVKLAAIAAGLPKVSPHWMRHSHAFHAAEKKVPLNVIQMTLGHSSLGVLAQYMHARPDDSSGLYLEEM